MEDVTIPVLSESDAVYAANKFIDMFVDNDCKPCQLVFSTPEGKYSAKQRKSSHSWYRMCANVINDLGHTRTSISKMTGDPIELPWNEVVFKAFYKDILWECEQIESTEDQKSKTPAEIRMYIDKHFADRGIILPDWPSARG